MAWYDRPQSEWAAAGVPGTISPTAAPITGATPTTPPAGMDALMQAFAANQFEASKAQKLATEGINRNLLQRGVVQSGFGTEALQRSVADITGAQGAANNAAALDWARQGQQANQFGQTLANQQYEFGQNRANQLSDANVAARSDMMGNLLKLLFGGAMGGTGAGAGGNIMQWLAKMLGGSAGGGGAAGGNTEQYFNPDVFQPNVGTTDFNPYPQMDTGNWWDLGGGGGGSSQSTQFTYPEVNNDWMQPTANTSFNPFGTDAGYGGAFGGNIGQGAGVAQDGLTDEMRNLLDYYGTSY